MSRKDMKIYETRMAVYTRDGWRCRICGDSGVLQLAHRIPQTKSNLRKYGPEVIHDPDNLVTTCPRHNSSVLVGQNWEEEAEIVKRVHEKITARNLEEMPL